ncbi:MAG: PD-(D/E)XK nuclease family protein, partial [Sinobacterium sp.]|nr:PD-(D/E)XK nuclease family protein [Sinobacterium sp.]
VNSLFSQHENTFVQAGFPPYPEVKSPDAFSAWQGLVVSDEKGVEQSAALSVFSQFDQQLKKSDGTEFVAQQTAQFLSQLLSKGSRINGQAIQPKDIAILVRKSAQAKIMQSALSAEGLNSIFLSKQTVLESDDVPAFIRLVKACVSPFDKSAVLAALGDSLIGFNLDKLEELNCDPSELFVIQDSFSEAKKIAQSKGFIVMWQWLVNRFDIATQLLSGLQGERRLTNINQLAEIVHAQVPSSDLEQQLQAFIDIYLECTQGDGDDTNSQKMRLESEANLIEIVTIHGSKGLEYPMVCCPFVSESDGLRKGFSKLFQPDKSAYEIIWEASDAQKKLLLADQLAEDVRLLYVAFTRAKYHLNISWQPFKGVEATPLWHILSTTGLSAIKESNEDEFKAFFTTLNGCVVNPVASDVTIKTDACGSDWQWQLKALTRNFYEPMVARSYSALLGSHHSGGQLPAGEEAWQSELQESLANDEGRDEVAEIIETVDVYALNMFNFPRGAHAGNFLHLLYETVNFQDSATFIPCIEKLSEHYLIHEKWQACLVEHLEQFMLKPLVPLNVCLANLSAASIKKEMGFHLIAKPTQGREVAEILSQYRGGAGLESLNDMQGLFKGFIDLIFEHQGKFYVLDYKSNHLGHHFSDYHLEQMHDAMLDHNYDLQYLVYTCALHLYLQQRIHNYAYDEHMGGIFYTFIRGVNEHDASGIYFKRPELSTIQRLSSLFE